MKDEFLKKCRERVQKAKLSVSTGNEEDGVEIMLKTASEVTTELLSQLNPATVDALIFVIPALRNIADSFEGTIPENDKKLASFIYSALSKASKVKVREGEEK